MDWRDRERQRLDTRVHKPLIPELARLCPPEHYAHQGKFGVGVVGSNKFGRGVVAFTRNEDEGVCDVQRRMRISAYLEQYVPALTKAEALELERKQAAC